MKPRFLLCSLLLSLTNVLIHLQNIFVRAESSTRYTLMEYPTEIYPLIFDQNTYTCNETIQKKQASQKTLGNTPP